jgi:hypothetical protein
MIARTSVLVALGAFVGVLVGGCGGGDVGEVSGKVTLGGQPLTEGVVVFENAAAGISVNATLGPDGTYTAKTYDRNGLPPGTYQVAVKPVSIGDGETPLASDPSQAPGAAKSAIPEKYHSTKTSELSVTVAAGENPPFDFDLNP